MINWGAQKFQVDILQLFCNLMSRNDFTAELRFPFRDTVFVFSHFVCKRIEAVSHESSLLVYFIPTLIVKRVVKKGMEWRGLDSCSLEYGHMEGCCECGHERTGFIKLRRFLEY